MNTLFSYITIKTETQDLGHRNCELTVYHFRGHDSLSLAVLNGSSFGALPTREGQGIVSPFHLKVIYGQKCGYCVSRNDYDIVSHMNLFRKNLV